MRPQIFLHIGMHKTGTTYLQHLFRECRTQLLRADGLLFPETGLPRTEEVRPKPGGLPGHHDFARKSRRKVAAKNLAAEIAEHNANKVFISAENLSLSDAEFSSSLVKDLELIGSVSIILVLRRQDRWIDSYYRERVVGNVQGETRDFKTYLAEEGPLLLDYRTRYQNWQKTAFSGQFLVASYDDLTIDNRLLRWFCDGLQISPKSAKSLQVTQVPKNAALTCVDVEITRIVNLVPGLKAAKRSKLLRRIYEIGNLPDASFVSDDIYDELRACYEPKNNRLAEEWAIHPAQEFCNWRRTKQRSKWDENLDMVTRKLREASEGLDAQFQETGRKLRPFGSLRAKLSQIRFSRIWD